VARRRALAAAVILALLLPLLPVAVAAAEQSLALEMVLNGRPTGRVGAFVERDGMLYAQPDDLRELGLRVPPGVTHGSDPIPLSALPGVQARLDEAHQTLVVQAPDSALLPTELSNGASAASLAPLSPPGYGLVLNYDLLGTFTGQHGIGADWQDTGGATLDLRAFTPYGVLENTGLVNMTPYSGEATTVRLSSTFDYVQPDDMRRWRAGDLVTGAVSWSRAVRLGGFQVSSDFAVRPDLITYPLPVLSASAAVPSTVDVMVNGIRQFGEAVQPGPFAVHSLPVVTGAGEVAVTVTDALGRQTLVTLPFYASSALLRPGLASFSLEGGTMRYDYGLIRDHYAGEASSGVLRYGITDWLTLEGHEEASSDLALLGGGITLKLGSIGVLDAAMAGSTGPPPAATTLARSGGQAAVGFQRVSRGLSFNLAGTWTTGDYRDIAALGGASVPRSTLNASLGYQFGRFGSVGIGYVSQVASAALPLSSEAQESLLPIAGTTVSLATLSYSVPIRRWASFYATAFKDLHDGHNFGVTFGVSIPLGKSASASVGGSVENGRPDTELTVAKPALVANDYGYRVQDVEGLTPVRSAQGEYLSPWGRVTAGVSEMATEHAVQAGASGSLVLADGHPFAGDQVNDSFAIVSTGGIPGVPVLYENRPVGVTDSSGHLMVPSLLSYQNNRVAVDVSRLPPDVDVGQTTVEVRPPDRSGPVVDFHIRRVHAALVTLQDANGKPIPLGSIAKVTGEDDQPVGFDGQAYLTGLKASNHVEVALPSGGSCSVQFDYRAVPGDIPAIGPVRCQ